MQISRRKLGALGLSGLAACLLRAHPVQSQSVGGRKKRLITIMTPMGQMPQWLPTQGNDGLVLSNQGQSLEPVKEKLLYINNTRSALTSAGAGSGAHLLGFQAPYTGSGYRQNGNAVYTRNASIDQILAAEFGRPPLVLGAVNSDLQATISYLPAPAQGEGAVPVPPQTNARIAYNSLFADFGKTEEELERLRALRGSVLDLWSDQIGAALPQVSYEGRSVLEAHLTQIRETERRLDESMGQDVSCEPVSITQGNDFYGRNAARNFPTIIRQMMDIIATAFACDMADAATLSFDKAQSFISHTWATDVTRAHHGLTHNAGVQANDDALFQIHKWQTEQVAYLLTMLDSLPDPEGGTLLDSTIVYWSSELGNYTSHSGYNMRTLISGGSHFTTNRFVNHTESNQAQKSQNDILAEIYYACTGNSTNAFRDDRMSTVGERSDLRA